MTKISGMRAKKAIWRYLIGMESIQSCSHASSGFKEPVLSNFHYLTRLREEARVAEPLHVRGCSPIGAAVYYAKENIYRKLLSDSRINVNGVVTTSGTRY